MKEIWVFAANAADVDEARPVSEGRAKRAAQLANPADRRRSLAAEWALDAALCALEPGYVGPPRYRRAPGGKPELAKGKWHISLAHAGDWAICAIADCPLGVDIERRDRKSRVPIRQWVGIESYLKLTGEGLGGDFRTLRADESAIFRDQARLAHLARGELGDYLICAAAAEPCSIRIQTL